MLHTNHDNFTSILMSTSSPYPVHKVNVASRPGLDVFLIPLKNLSFDSALRKPLPKVWPHDRYKQITTRNVGYVPWCRLTLQSHKENRFCANWLLTYMYHDNTHCQTGSASTYAYGAQIWNHGRDFPKLTSKLYDRCAMHISADHE